jgi:hypothetical protein
MVSAKQARRRAFLPATGGRIAAWACAPFSRLDASSCRKRVSNLELRQLEERANSIVARMAAEKEIVGKIALRKGRCARTGASKIISAAESAPRLAQGVNLRRSFSTLCRISTGETDATHPVSAGLLAFYDYTRQTGLFA